MSIEAMKQALQALEYAGPSWAEARRPAAEALRAAIEQAEKQKPKCGAIIEVFGKDWRLEYMSLPVGKHRLYTQQYEYTAPPQREWVGLTDEEVRAFEVWLDDEEEKHGWNPPQDIIKYIEAKLKEKNNG